MEYHIWEITNPIKTEICVDIEDSFKDYIYSKIKNKFTQIAEDLNIQKARLYEYFFYKNSFIPLTTLLYIGKLIFLNNYKLESKILEYRQKSSDISIKKPKLPLQLSPISTSLVAHLYFDGSLPNDGRCTYYNNKSEEIMSDYINSIYIFFGKVDHSNKRDHRGILKCRMPRLIGEILKYIYQVNSFNTKNSFISDFIFNLSYEHKVAFILTALIDEGSIAYDGSIIFGVMNKKLAKQTKQLFQELNIKTGNLKQKKNSEFYYFYVKDIMELSKIIKLFSKKYPLISLRQKLNRLNKAIEIKNRKFKYTKEFSDKRIKIILNSLTYKQETINSLSDKLLIPPRTIRRYMYKLIKENKIIRFKSGYQYIYSLNKV